MSNEIAITANKKKLTFETVECKPDLSRLDKEIDLYDWCEGLENMVIKYVHPELKEEYFEKLIKIGNEEYTGDDSFRAIALSNDLILIFPEDYETADSIAWITIHELTHRAIRKTGLLTRYFSKLDRRFFKQISIWGKIEEILRDEVHENQPEEVFANNVATTIIGYPYDRCWWREAKRKSNEKK